MSVSLFLVYHHIGKDCSLQKQDNIDRAVPVALYGDEYVSQSLGVSSQLLRTRRSLAWKDFTISASSPRCSAIFRTRTFCLCYYSCSSNIVADESSCRTLVSHITPSQGLLSFAVGQTPYQFYHRVRGKQRPKSERIEPAVQNCVYFRGFPT